MSKALTESELTALEVLEAEVAARDGVRLKLEWPSLRDGRVAAPLTHHDGSDLVGFLGLYALPGGADVELTGMVHPDHRRRGIATGLWQRGQEICDRNGYTHRLAVVPRNSPSAAALLHHQAAQTGRPIDIDHSEYSMLLRDAPALAPEQPEVTLRPATDADQAHLIRILTAGFGPPPEDMVRRLHTDRSQTLMVEHDGAAIGTLRLALSGSLGGVFGFAIDPEWRGRGIGRDVLGRCCADLRARGAREVELQVEAENDAALHLYTSIGFEPISTEDYYRLS